MPSTPQLEGSRSFDCGSRRTSETSPGWWQCFSTIPLHVWLRTISFFYPSKYVYRGFSHSNYWTVALSDCGRAATLWDTGMGTLGGQGGQCLHIPEKPRHFLSYSHREVGPTCHQHTHFVFALDLKTRRGPPRGLKSCAGLLYLVSSFTQNYSFHIFWCLHFQRVVICEQRSIWRLKCPLKV